MGGITNSARRTAVVLLAALVAFAATPVVGGVAQEEAPAPREAAADVLQGILDRVVEALSHLDGEELPILQQQLTAIVELLEGLVERLEAAEAEEGEPSLRRQVLRLDLMMRELVATLERLVARQEQASPPSPEEIRAREALAGLRSWATGYIAGMLQGMRPEQAQEFRRLAQGLLDAVAAQVARLVGGVIDRHEEPTALEILLARVQELVRRLDAFIARYFEPSPQPPRRR